MIVACLDLEGVLLPEIWINIAEKSQIPELRLTTRDISDYDDLMRHRLRILKENEITIDFISDIIKELKPMDGAKEFLYKLKEKFQVIILSDTYYQFSMPLMKHLDYPTLFCHNLIIDNNGYITDYKLRMKDSKKNAVIKLKELNFKVISCGDSYNDISMLNEADKGILFKPPQNVIDEFPHFPVTMEYRTLLEEFLKAEEEIVKLVAK